MKVLTCLFGILLCLTGIFSVSPAEELTLGQSDTFEDGTTQNWVINLLGTGSPPAAALPVNVPTGGPGGVDDNFLQLSAVGGIGAGSRLSVINFMGQWMGDYLAAGISAIVMDVSNLGSTDLFLRLLFADPTAEPPANLAFSTDPVFVPAGSGWQRVIFPITPADLTANLGNVVDALTGATEIRIFHSPIPVLPTAPIFPGPEVVASLGVDNITAVPLPTGLLLMGSGVLTLAALMRRF